HLDGSRGRARHRKARREPSERLSRGEEVLDVFGTATLREGERRAVEAVLRVETELTSAPPRGRVEDVAVSEIVDAAALPRPDEPRDPLLEHAHIARR